VVDAQIGYKVFKNKGEFKVSASDIFNEKYNFVFELDGKPYTPSGFGNTFRAFRPGSTYSLSFNYTF
jgi:outer membrane receptor protein involved in Fe transport